MATERDMIDAIERDEAWLGKVAPPDPQAALERIKHRVRIEVNQVWVERDAPADPLPGNLGAIKAAMRNETARLAGVNATGLNWAPARRVTALATAAVIMFAAGLALWRPGGSADTDMVVVAEVDDWVDAVAWDVLASTESTAELASLRVELVSLETSLTADESFAWVEGELDDVGDELEVLLTEIG